MDQGVGVQAFQRDGQGQGGLLCGALAALVGAGGAVGGILGVRRGAGGQAEVTLWFARSRAELAAGIEEMGESAGEHRLWILWPKKASGVASDLSQTIVRRAGLAVGLVDYKVCSVDSTWSGLKFTLRRG